MFNRVVISCRGVGVFLANTKVSKNLRVRLCDCQNTIEQTRSSRKTVTVCIILITTPPLTRPFLRSKPEEVIFRKNGSLFNNPVVQFFSPPPPFISRIFFSKGWGGVFSMVQTVPTRLSINFEEEKAFSFADIILHLEHSLWCPLEAVNTALQK